MSVPGRNRGEDNFRNKLTQDEVVTIFLCTDVKQQELAKRYNVSQSTINHIKSGRTWAWLTRKVCKDD